MVIGQRLVGYLRRGVPGLLGLLDCLAHLFGVLFDMFAQRDDLSEIAARFDE
jgi:hypothetical protein